MFSNIFHPDTNYIFEPNHIFTSPYFPNQDTPLDTITPSFNNTSSQPCDEDTLEISTQLSTLVLVYESICYLLTELSYLHKINNNIFKNKSVLTNYYHQYNNNRVINMFKNSSNASKYLDKIFTIYKDLTNIHSLNRIILLKNIFEYEESIYITDAENSTPSKTIIKKLNLKQSYLEWRSFFYGNDNFNLDENAKKTIDNTNTNDDMPFNFNLDNNTNDLQLMAHSNVNFIFWLLETGIYNYFIENEDNKYDALEIINSRTPFTGGLFIQYQLFINDYLKNHPPVYIPNKNIMENYLDSDKDEHDDDEQDEELDCDSDSDMFCECKCHSHNYENRFFVTKQIVCYCCDDLDGNENSTDEEEDDVVNQDNDEDNGASSDELSEECNQEDEYTDSDAESDDETLQNFRHNPDILQKGYMLRQFGNEILNIFKNN